MSKFVDGSWNDPNDEYTHFDLVTGHSGKGKSKDCKICNPKGAKMKTPRSIIENLTQSIDWNYDGAEEETIKETLSALRECVLAKKYKPIPEMEGMDDDMQLYNKAIDDIANLFGEGK